MSHASDSTESHSVEAMARTFLAEQNGLVYEPAKVVVEGEYVEIDAIGKDNFGAVVHLVEIYALQGKLESSQLKKPTDDAARLLLAQKMYPQARLSLAWCSAEAIGQVERGWRGKALEIMGVDFIHVEIAADVE